jgi:FtsH-binding integral membrane protein
MAFGTNQFPLQPGIPGHFSEVVVGAAERSVFLRKVFGLVLLGLVCTGVGAVAGLDTGLSFALRTHPILGIGLFFGLFFGAQAGRHVSGLNLALLALFTGFAGVYLAPAVAFAGPAVAGNALATTCLVFVGLSVYATVTKRDFSFLGAFIFTAILALVAGQLLNAFFFHSPAAWGAFAVVGCFVFSAAILFDVWRLSRTMSFDEPVAFALTLYLDFINLFLFVLMLFTQRGGGRGNSRSWS